MDKAQKSSLVYRIGTINDLDQLQDLRLSAYGQFEGALTPENWSVFIGNLRNKERLGDLLRISTCFVSTDNKKIVGSAYIVPSGNPTEHFKTEWSHIRMVGVDPTYRGQGIAKALTNMCIDFARKNNETTIALHTSEFMNAARHIYESIGFRVHHEIPLLYGKRYWIYTMNLSDDKMLK